MITRTLSFDAYNTHHWWIIAIDGYHAMVCSLSYPSMARVPLHHDASAIESVKDPSMLDTLPRIEFHAHRVEVNHLLPCYPHKSSSHYSFLTSHPSHSKISDKSRYASQISPKLGTFSEENRCIPFTIYVASVLTGHQVLHTCSLLT